jgi:hypothetical protein
MGVGVQRHALAALPPPPLPKEKDPVWTGAEKSHPHRESIQSVASHYTDWAIPVHTESTVQSQYSMFK